MLKKRIIACFDVKNGRVVKGINFLNLVDAGNAVEMAKVYACSGVDELVFLDIAATNENRSTLIGLVTEIASEINIPFTVGGGIRTVADAKLLLKSGADKISINTAAINNPQLITDIAAEFGSQAVVVAIDTKLVDGKWNVFANGGTVATGITAEDWAVRVAALGAGEILLTSMNNDGQQSGFALAITGQISDAVPIPVIASGGAGTMQDFSDVFTQTTASAALAASVFHFGKIELPELKQFLKNNKIAVR